MTAVDLVRKMRERLTTKGWRQRAYGTHDGPNCLSGALLYENDPPWGYSPAQIKVREEIERVVGTGLITFNDTPGRTKEDVLTVLDEVEAELVAAE